MIEAIFVGGEGGNRGSSNIGIKAFVVKRKIAVILGERNGMKDGMRNVMKNIEKCK